MNRNKVQIILLTTNKSGILSFIMLKCGAAGLSYRKNTIDKISDHERRLKVYFQGMFDCEQEYLVKILEQNPDILEVESIRINASNEDTFHSNQAAITPYAQKETPVISPVSLLDARDAITADTLRIAEEKLSSMIGPVASILVNSAAKISKSNGDFFLILAGELEGEERQEFLSLVTGKK